MTLSVPQRRALARMAERELARIRAGWAAAGGEVVANRVLQALIERGLACPRGRWHARITVTGRREHELQQRIETCLSVSHTQTLRPTRC